MTEVEIHLSVQMRFDTESGLTSAQIEKKLMDFLDTLGSCDMVDTTYEHPEGEGK